MSDDRRERAMRVIKGLLEKRVARGATLGEEAAAAAKVQELLERYQISMYDIESQTLKDEMGRSTYDTGRKNSNPGEISLASAVATGYDCKLVISGAKYTFLGYSSDAEIAEYVFTYLLRTLKSMAESSGRAAGVYKQKMIRYRNNFLIGAAGVIRKRMLDDKVIRSSESTIINDEQPAVATKVTSTALAFIKKPKVDEYVKSQYKRLYERPASKVKYNINAIDAGRKAGATVQIRKAVEVDQSKLLV